MNKAWHDLHEVKGTSLMLAAFARQMASMVPAMWRSASCEAGTDCLYFKGLRPWAGSARRSPGRAVSKHVEAPKLP